MVNQAEKIAMRTFLAPSLVLLLPCILLAAEEAPSKDAEAPASKNLLSSENDLEAWTLELTDKGYGEMKVEDDAIVFTTKDTTGTDWHVQAYQTGLPLEDGKDYVVKFKMKSPEKVTLLLVGQVHEPDWHEIGLHEEVRPTEEFEDYEYEFTADNTAEKNNRIGFVLGIDKGAVHVKEMTLTEKDAE
jgi:hypothetical protein